MKRVPALAVLTAVWASQFALVQPTNFTPNDEWLYVSLTSRGIVGFPHSQRPLILLWALPGALLRHRFIGFHLLDGLYMLLGGWLVFLLVRRLVDDAGVALLAGVFTLVWAPRDMARLLTVQTVVNNGVTAAALLALVLLVGSWCRRRAAWLGLAVVVAFTAMRSYEAVAPMLVAGALLVPWQGGWSRAAWRWGGGFALALLLIFGLNLAALRRPEASYVQLYGFDPRPSAVGARLLDQFGFHLLPLVSPPPTLASPAVALAVAVFTLGCVLVPSTPGPRRRLAVLGGAGLLLAAAAYLPFAMLADTQSATRTQFLSAPGIAMLLASAAVLLGSLLPGRLRRAGAVLLGAWVVALGTANTLAMQEQWREESAYPGQMSLLRQLTRQAPDLRPHTLLVLVDERRAFPATFALRHAVGYLYEWRAAALGWGASDYLYAASFAPEGVRFEPWPAVRGPWRDEPTTYGYDEVVAARYAADGRLSVLPQWPPELPPLPPIARYDPEARIVRGGPPVPAQEILLGP